MVNMLYRKCIKRLLDIVFSAIGILILSPIMLFTALMVRIKIGTPVIFLQERPGKHERIFKMYKFRSMSNAIDDYGNLLSDEARLTPFGRKLRASSLDELPELLNVLKGDMSIVGPRPLLAQYLPLYNVEQRHRHDVRPGLTGLAQVSGRNGISWENRFRLDVEYIHSLSFRTDIKIVFLSIYKVIKREGINSENSLTMKPFLGSEDKDKKDG